MAQVITDRRDIDFVLYEQFNVEELAKHEKYADFKKVIEKHIKENSTCHMHFRDYSTDWNKNSYIDVAVDIDENT